MGKDGFTWFVGVVEDRNDPKKLGRLRVRCLGYHVKELNKLPTADLPWAHVMNPITSATVSGVGNTPLGAVEGTWVVGFFIDGPEAQNPMIMGTLPGVPKDLPVKDAVDGFQDYINANYPKYKESDVNRLGVNLKSGDTETNPHLSLTLRRATRITGVATADFNPVTAADGSAIAGSDGDTFDQPTIPFAAVYPRNHVYESESGHIQEYDDTPGSERIHERHRTGTSYEIDKDGNKVEIIKGSSFRLLSNKEQVQIQGDSDISIDGRHKIYINKTNVAGNNYDIQVGTGANVNIQVDSGDVNIVTVQGKMNLNSGGDMNVKVGGNYNMTVAGNRQIDVEGTTTDNTTGNVIHRGARIDLNP